MLVKVFVVQLWNVIRLSLDLYFAPADWWMRHGSATQVAGF